jgi:ABC-type spermidine/putrescine transport system permease subunit II
MASHEATGSLASRQPASRPSSGWGARAAKITLWLVAGPSFAFLAVPTLIIIPMAFTESQLLRFPPEGFSLAPFRNLAQDTQWTEAAVTSVKVAAIAVVLSCVVATTAAISLHGWQFRGKGLVVAIILVPLIAPLVVLALADYQFLARYQLVGTVQGIGLAHAVIATPFVFLSVQASLAGLDPALERSAKSLGAGTLNLWRHVYWPAVRPGLLAGALFAFIASFDEIVIALFLQGPGATTLPVKMYTDIQFELTPKIAAVAAILVGAATTVLLIQAILLMRRRALMSSERVA